MNAWFAPKFCNATPEEENNVVRHHLIEGGNLQAPTWHIQTVACTDESKADFQKEE